MLLSGENNLQRNECTSKNPENVNLKFPFLTASTATRYKLRESVETANIFLPSSDGPLLQPKKRLPLNMVISAMAERGKGLFSETEETRSTLSKIKDLKEDVHNRHQKTTLRRRCKKHRNGMPNHSNDNPEQPHHISGSIHLAHKSNKSDKCGYVGQDIDQSNLNGFSGSHHTPYSTPYAKSRFQQLYGNGVRTNFDFLAADTVAKDSSDYRPISDILHPVAISDTSSPDSNTYYTPPQEHKEVYTNNPRPFITSHDFLECADVPEELDSTSMQPHTQINHGHTFNNSTAEDCEPSTCFRVTYTKKNITYLNKDVQNNINITESHYEFIFEPKIIIEETGEQLSIPDLASR